MIISKETIACLGSRILAANERYGPFASTHEALGVSSEEWDEFRGAIKSNDASRIQEEALDLAAVLIRLAEDLERNANTRQRSTK